MLKSRASPVTEFGDDLRSEVERMIAIMRDGLGVGLAATQLGVLRRVLVVQSSTDAEPAALVNPVIERFSGDLVTAEEGCLSLPRVSVDVERPLHVAVRRSTPTAPRSGSRPRGSRRGSSSTRSTTSTGS